MKKITYIKLKDNYEDEINKIVNDEIKKVLDVHPEVDISIKDRNQLRARALDQVCVHISTRAKLRNGWGFNLGNEVPIQIDYVGLSEAQVNKVEMTKCPKGAYSINNDLSWRYKKDLTGITKDEMEVEIYEMIKEDAAIAAFYSAYSYVTGDK